MSAELLRRAATSLRADASACTTEVPWHTVSDLSTFDREDAEYISRMKPVVALAVADWLEQAAIHFEGGSLTVHPMTKRALAVARAYLGEDA